MLLLSFSAVTACARSGGKCSVVAVVILRCNRVREEQVTTTPRNAEKRRSDCLRKEQVETRDASMLAY